MTRVKLANCTPEGRFSVTSEIFEGDYWELDLNLFGSLVKASCTIILMCLSLIKISRKKDNPTDF